MIEEYAIACIHAIGFAVVHRYPEGIHLSYSIRRTWVKRCLFTLRCFLHFTIQLRCGCLVYLRLLFKTQYAYGLQYAQRTYGVGISTVFRLFEAYLHMA